VTLPVANTLAPILPAVQRQWLAEHRETPYVDPSAVEANAVGRIHMKTTVNQLLSASQTIRDAVDRGDVAIVGCQYSLVEGRAIPYISVGKLDIEVADAS
jgi:carbonic anhydrase